MPSAGIVNPTIDVAGAMQQGRQDANVNQANEQTNQAQMVEMLAHGAAAALPQGPNGPVDPAKWNEVMDTFEKTGMPPDKVKAFRDHPELATVLLKGSATALKNQYDAASFERSLQMMDQQITALINSNSRTPAPAIESQYDPTTGTDQKMQWNATDAVWEPFGGPKSATATDKTSPETWFGNIVYMRDPKTQKIVAGQASSWGRFKPMEGADGLEPAVPVQQLNTETGFQPVTKFGDVPANAPVTPINNEDAARDTAIGKGEGEKIVALPEVQAADTGALNSLQRQVGIVTGDIDKAIKQIDANPGWNTGFIGDLASAVKGTPQYDLAQTLLTIKANVGFDQLQQMRDNSKTGGALGSVSDTETALLQAVNGAMAQGQSADQLKANLKRISELQAQVVAEKQAAYQKKYGGGDGSPADTPASSPSGEAGQTKIIDGVKYINKGGGPDDWYAVD